MLKFIKDIFKKHEYKRAMPENIREGMHKLLDFWIDTDDYHSAFELSFELQKRVDSARELFSLKRIEID